MGRTQRRGEGAQAIVLMMAMLCGGVAQATCYSVYDKGGALIHRSVEAPVDLSGSMREAVARRFGDGSSMVIAQGGPDSCSQPALPARKQAWGAGGYIPRGVGGSNIDPALSGYEKTIQAVGDVCDARGVKALAIGMPKDDALCAPGWRFPKSTNTTTTANGVREQVVYGGYGRFESKPKYLYFQNGKLTAIQE